MAGIYLHIPYCKVKCHYCDFHFSTQHRSIPEMVAAMHAEIDQRFSYLKSESISTIYFGGGTPSLFSSEIIGNFISKIKEKFSVSADVEITIECNPDDLDREKLSAFKTVGVNRLSIGVQSFSDEVLKFMNRAHNNVQALNCIDDARAEGIENITIDLIYGVPNTDLNYWKDQLNVFEKLDLAHLSSYCLTIEPKTYFGKQNKLGLLNPVHDEKSLEQFQYLIDFMRERNFEQYEISNFAKPGFISKHNSAYWLGASYLGIGPSAHSYDVVHRGWNVANNSLYIQKVKSNLSYHEEEELTIANRCNDYLLTRLRTKWGIDFNDLNFVPSLQIEQMRKKIFQYCEEHLMIKQGSKFLLTDAGKYRADGIAAHLFI